MKIGGGADAAGIIDGDLAVVYGRPDFFEGAQVVINGKDGVVKQQLDLPEPEAVPGNPELQMVKFNLAELSFGAGEELDVLNVEQKNDINIGFVMN